MAQTTDGAVKIAASRIGISVAEYTERVVNGLKWCTACKSWHGRDAFNVDRSRFDGLAATCAKGRRQRHATTYIPRERTSRAGVLLVASRDGDKKQARARVNHEVDVGRRPDPNALPCTDCEHVYTEGGRRHEYDHHLGYSAEHQLSVEAVCTTCHHAREASR